MLDIEKIRSDTPGCDEAIHFNNAGSSLPPRPVVDAMVEYLREEARYGGYETADLRTEDLSSLYGATSDLLGCRPDEVAFVTSASDGWWRAFSAVPLAPGDRILVSRSEFQANAFGWLQAQDRGVEVSVVPNDSNGLLDLDAFDELLDERVKVVSLTQISMSNAAIQPAEAVGERIRDHEAIYLLDACQAVGQLAINVDGLGCDFLMYTGRKWMRGPRGTGILYARAGIMDRLGRQPFVDGRSAEWEDDGSYSLASDARRFEFGEQNYAGKVGLAVATRYLHDVGVEHAAARIQALRAEFAESIGSINGVEVRDEGVERCGIVTFTVRGAATREMTLDLRSKGLNISMAGRRNAQYDLGWRELDAVLRASIHYFNTMDEVHEAATLISEL